MNKEMIETARKVADLLDKSGVSYSAPFTIRMLCDEMERIESPRPDWTPCAEGLPTKDGAYDVTVKSAFGKLMLLPGYFRNGTWWNCPYSEHIIAWKPKPAPYNPDRKEDVAVTAHDKKAPPAKWCCGKPPIGIYHESEIGLSSALYTIKCQVCHSGVQVNVENDTEEAYDAALKHAVELWNEKVQHRPPMNSEIYIPETEGTV